MTKINELKKGVGLAHFVNYFEEYHFIISKNSLGTVSYKEATENLRNKLSGELDYSYKSIISRTSKALKILREYHDELPGIFEAVINSNRYDHMQCKQKAIMLLAKYNNGEI